MHKKISKSVSAHLNLSVYSQVKKCVALKLKLVLGQQWFNRVWRFCDFCDQTNT